MRNYDYDIGILGGGAAGLTVASGAAQLGAKTILIEKESRLGGDCLHYGCVPSKTLIKTARVYHAMKNGPQYGLPQVDVPPVDYRKITAHIQSVIDIIQLHDSEERFRGLGARVEFGEPVFTDEHTVKLGGRSFTAANWLVSTGSSASVPSMEGLDQTPYITNREIFSLDRLPESMVILGAGPIAVEMAQTFRRLGTRIIVVQRSDRILSKEDKDMAGLVMECLKKEGVEFHVNSKVLSVRDLGNAREVTFTNAVDGIQKVTGEMLLVALGRKASLAGLNLEAAGVEYSPKGIKVDARLRSTQKHIYAAGDVTGSYLFTHAAGYEGGIVLSNAVFHLPRKLNYTFLPWCTYTEPELASIGMNEKAAQKAGIDYDLWEEDFKDNDRSLTEGEKSGKIKLLLDKNEKPLGIQIFGLAAGELVNEWVAVMNGKVKLSTLAGAVHPYPTLGEINKKVAGDVMARKIFSDTVKKGLKFFFHLKGRACVAD